MELQTFEQQQLTACLQAVCRAAELLQTTADIVSAREAIQNYYQQPVRAMQVDSALRSRYPQIEYIERVWNGGWSSRNRWEPGQESEIIARLRMDIFAIQVARSNQLPT